jgi:HTH-type transcriptional repressor of NAD biosynthesis genes
MAKKSEKAKRGLTMRKGFVLGKFLPLHTGHLALIDFALKHCDHLYVVLCFTPDEYLDGMIRQQWLHEEVGKNSAVSILSFPYHEHELPNTSESSRLIAEKWAVALQGVVPEAEIVFTSEPYGEYLAEYMGIMHQSFNEKRDQFPVSGSLIKKNPLKYWRFISHAAKPWYVKKIALLGSESTGKSILTKRLADHYNTCFVPEMAREIIEKTNDCDARDLQEIALLHAKTIRSIIGGANKLLFLDTDINITKSYSRFLFDQEMVVDPWIEEANKSDLYLFLETDCPFIQDGTRLGEAERIKLAAFHKEQLTKNHIDFVIVNGDWENRFTQSVNIIQKKYFA